MCQLLSQNCVSKILWLEPLSPALKIILISYPLVKGAGAGLRLIFPFYCFIEGNDNYLEFFTECYDIFSRQAKVVAFSNQKNTLKSACEFQSKFSESQL